MKLACRKTQLGLCLAALCLVSSPLLAEMCTDDVVPAATLLLPYFEVAMDDPMGVTTLFHINNAMPEAALTHVTLWTDWSIPTIDFDLFLTGYDVAQVNLWHVFNGGNIPITADEQSDPSDFVSPHGLNPEWDASFTAGPDCINFFPFFINPVINGINLDRIRNGHNGFPIQGTDICFGEARYGTGTCIPDCPEGIVARGYVTIDSVNECGTDFPSDPGYFALNGTGVANNKNTLWGDYFIVDVGNQTMATAPLVHIEAQDDFTRETATNGYTFYGRYSPTGADNREPLGTQWAARYFNGGIAQTEFVVWRDSTSSLGSDEPTTCGAGPGAGPDWKPLDQVAVTCFDEEENVADVCTDGPCFGLETQKVSVADLGIPYDSGWCRLDLNIEGDDFPGDVDFPDADSRVVQSHVSLLHRGTSGTFLGGLPAVQLNHACNFAASTGLAFFADGFETGNTSRWSNSSP